MNNVISVQQENKLYPLMLVHLNVVDSFSYLSPPSLLFLPSPAPGGGERDRERERKEERDREGGKGEVSGLALRATKRSLV